jgi:hypothetical protein
MEATETDDVKRERFATRLLLVLAASAIAQALILRHHGLVLSSVPDRFGTVLLFSVALTLISAFTANLFIPGSKAPRFFVRNPSVVEMAEIEAGTIERLKGSLDWLKQRGFRITPQDSGQWTFEKGKQKPLHSFLSHQFSGRIRVVQDQGKSRLELKLILWDLILIDTNENEALSNLARYILGLTETLTVKTLPFTLICGVTLLLSTHLFTYLSILNRDLTMPLVEGYLGAFGFSAWMTVAVLRRRSELVGVRIGILTGFISLASLGMNWFR